MQTLTFTQKLLRQRSFLSSLLPLFALFVGLGASQNAVGQTITNSKIFISRNGAVNETFNANPNTPKKFDGIRLGTYDINTGKLILNGGAITTTAPSGTVFTAAFLDYTVSDSAGNAVNAGSLLLTGGSTSAGVRTFTLASAGEGLLKNITVAGSGYAISVSYRANPRTGTVAGSPVFDNNSGPGYTALFNVTGVLNNAVISNPTVIVDQGNGSNTYQASAFDMSTLADETPSSAATPSFNINTGKLILKGGSLMTVETGARTVIGASLDYVVFAPDATQLTFGTLQLAQDGPTVSGVRNFKLTSGTTNLIDFVATAANGNIIQVSYHITYQDNGTGAFRTNDDNNGAFYKATFDVDGIKTPKPTITANIISFDPNGVPPATTPPTPNDITTYNINPSTPNPFQNANLGTNYDVNDGQLLLDNTSVTTTEAGGSSISSVSLYYRTRAVGQAAVGPFQSINLIQSGNTVNGQKTFVVDTRTELQNGTNTLAQPNLIATPAVTAPGNYVVEIYYQASGFNTNTGNSFTITDPPVANTYYMANFTVTGTVIATTIWTGSKNDNWFDPVNWSNGVPTAGKNALIRDLGTGVSVPYPNINSDVVVYVTGSTNVAYDNTGKGPAEVLNLTMGGSSQAQRSITRLIKGQLKVYGDFNNNYNSFIQREGTITEFAGISTQDPTQVHSNPSTQTITGGLFVRVDISGGGKKEVTGIMNISESLNFLTPSVNAVNNVPTNTKTALAANAGILYTNVSIRPPLTLPTIVFADRATTNGNNGAQINGETDESFLYGYAQTTRAGVGISDLRTFGNLGIELTFTGANAPGNIDVTRNTVEAYSPVNSRVGIRRIFGVRPGNPSTNTGGLQATMVFHYRTSETKNLGGNTTSEPGMAFIPEDKLVIFVSDNSGNTFGLVGRDGPVNTTNKTVTRTGVRRFATFTLGDIDNPLPVRLTAFDAKRIGNDALVTWQTATEQNSKGYDVQVSTNGTEFRTLASVPSASPNTVKLTSYSYTDTEKNKAGTRYYRLHQVDLDGKEAFFAPVAVSFDGKATAATLVAYPNPFNGNDELHVAIQSVTAGKGQLTITDMTGRTIRSTSVEVTSGLTDFTVNNMVDLKSGLYLVKFLLPSGEVKNLKIVKQ